MNNGSAVTQTYNSFSGVDMIVTFGNVTVGEVQGVSYTVTREKAPLYTMGSANPRSFSRGKRGIAGSLIFLVFDRSALLDISQKVDLKDNNGKVILKKTELTKGQMGTLATSTEKNNVIDAVTGSKSETSQNSPKAVLDFMGLKRVGATYHDQLPPFNITISAANEYGHVARMQIKNVEIMNAGSGMSIDDITTDESCTFVATEVDPWFAQGPIGGLL
jgi:hypothetical protein